MALSMAMETNAIIKELLWKTYIHKQEKCIKDQSGKSTLREGLSCKEFLAQCLTVHHLTIKFGY